MIEVIHTGPFGVNTLVVGLPENKCFIVDPAACALCGDEKAVTSFLAQKKLEPAAVVLTHGHFDHVAGLTFLKKIYPDVPILISRIDKDMIGGDSQRIQSRDLSLMGFEEFLPAVSNLPEADGFLDDGKNLKEILSETGGAEMKMPDDAVLDSLFNWNVISTPGHTMGSVCLYNAKEKLLLSGDTLFYGSWGRTDLGGSEEAIRKSLMLLKEKIPGDVKVYPGHDTYGFFMSDNF